MKTIKAPLMYKGWLIINKDSFLAITNPAKKLDINIQFTSWKECKEFINILID